MSSKPKLTYTNENGESVEFSTLSPFHVNVGRDVEGLNGVKTTVYTTAIVDVDGEKETGFHVEPRDITIVGHLNARGEAEQGALRRRLNHALSPYGKGTLTYTFGERVRVIDVRPEDAPTITCKVGAILPTFTLNLTANNPYWRDVEETETLIAGFVGGIEFPDGILELPETPFEMTTWEENPVIDYPGDVPTGMKIAVMKPSYFIKLEVLSRTAQTEARTITFSGTQWYNTVINTLKGARGVEALPFENQTPPTHTIRLLDLDNTEFFSLLQGENRFQFVCNFQEYVPHVTLKIRYTNLYVGV